MSPKKNVTWDLKPYNYSSDVKDDLLNEVKLTMEEIVDNNDNVNEEDANIFKLLKKESSCEDIVMFQKKCNSD